MRRVTLQFPPEGEGIDLILHADVEVGWRWTVTPPEGEGNPWIENTALNAPYIDLEPKPGVPYGFKVELVEVVSGNPVGFTHQEAITWAAQAVRTPIGFLMSVIP